MRPSNFPARKDARRRVALAALAGRDAYSAAAKHRIEQERETLLGLIHDGLRAVRTKRPRHSRARVPA